MKRRLFSPVGLRGFGVAAVSALFLVLIAARGQPAASPAAGTPSSFETFRLIGNLNIFNSSRVGWSPDVQQPRVDTIVLVGTMDSDQGRAAFFDSPDSAFRKVLHEGDAIAQFAVKKIAADSVDLTRNAKVITLMIRQQLRRPAGGDWSVAAYQAPVAALPATAAGTGAGAEADGATPPAPPSDDIIKRLMENRKKQLKQ